MYSSPIVVFAGSSWLSVVPTATRIVPCASAGVASAAIAASARMKRRMLLPLRISVQRILERLSRIWIDRARHIGLRHRRVLLPEPCQGGDWSPILVHAQVHERESLAVSDEKRCRDEPLNPPAGLVACLKRGDKPRGQRRGRIRLE